MPASCPASMLNQIIADLGILRLLQTSSRSKGIHAEQGRPSRNGDTTGAAGHRRDPGRHPVCRPARRRLNPVRELTQSPDVRTSRCKRTETRFNALPSLTTAESPMRSVPVSVLRTQPMRSLSSASSVSPFFSTKPVRPVTQVRVAAAMSSTHFFASSTLALSKEQPRSSDFFLALLRTKHVPPSTTTSLSAQVSFAQFLAPEGDEGVLAAVRRLLVEAAKGVAERRRLGKGSRSAGKANAECNGGSGKQIHGSLRFIGHGSPLCMV